MKVRRIIAAGIICFVVGAAAGTVGSGKVMDAVSTALNKANNQKVLVIDAGHGGFDGGASAADGTLEKDLNLEIALKLKEVASDYPVKIVMTRDKDEAVAGTKGADLKARKQLMEESGADLAVSIHMNSFPEDTSVYGAQVFYPVEKNSEQEKEQGSRTYAENVQKALETGISDGRERTAMEKTNVLLLENPPCSIILVECGFLSNSDELNRLKTAEYQQKLAEVIWAGINSEMGLEKEVEIPVIDSKNIPDFV